MELKDGKEKESLLGGTNALANAVNNTSEEVEKQEKQTGLASFFKDLFKSKIGGGGVLQYPIDLDTDLQDYFEIQIFKYRPAPSLPSITANNQGYTTDKDGNTTQPKAPDSGSGGYFANSNRRGNRQNFRLQDLQSTIQLPIPPSIKIQFLLKNFALRRLLSTPVFPLRINFFN